jgi:hypothetical protein
VAGPVVTRQSLLGPLAGRLLDACDRRDLDALRGVVADPALREAVEIASPTLGAQLDRFLAGDLGGRRTDRMLAALYRYGSRIRHRATPMGTFAGVGVARLAPIPGGSGPSADAAGRVVRAVRPSASWCAALCRRLATEDEALLDLRVTASRSAYSRPGSLIVLGADEDAGAAYAVTRHLPLVHAVLDRCAGWRSAGDVVAYVVTAAGCGRDEAGRFVLGMIRHGVLVTDLAEVDVAPEPFAALLDLARARAAGPSAWSGWTGVAGSLGCVQDLLAGTVRTAPVPVGRYRELRAAMAELHTETDLQVDTILTGRPPPLAPPAAELYRACRALALVSPANDHPVIRAAARWFADRYSDAHTVRLAEMFLPGSGGRQPSSVAFGENVSSTRSA